MSFLLNIFFASFIFSLAACAFSFIFLAANSLFSLSRSVVGSEGMLKSELFYKSSLKGMGSCNPLGSIMLLKLFELWESFDPIAWLLPEFGLSFSDLIFSCCLSFSSSILFWRWYLAWWTWIPFLRYLGFLDPRGLLRLLESICVESISSELLSDEEFLSSCFINSNWA